MVPLSCGAFLVLLEDYLMGFLYLFTFIYLMDCFLIFINKIPPSHLKLFYVC